MQMPREFPCPMFWCVWASVMCPTLETLSANVALVPRADGKLTVRKAAVGDGIDGNGAPWLRRQALFPGATKAVKQTDMLFVSGEEADEASIAERIDITRQAGLRRTRG